MTELAFPLLMVAIVVIKVVATYYEVKQMRDDLAERL